jgi:hypothetical protein
MQMKLIVSLTLCWLASSACDSDMGHKSAGEACTRSSQCRMGLRCLEGSCHSKRKLAPASMVDAGEPDAEASPEAGEPPAEVQGR